MSFASIETSTSDGRPTELYKFAYTLNEWHFTSADRDIVYLTNTYKAASISRSNLAPTSDPTKASLTVTLAGNSPIGDVFRVQPPSEPVLLTIFAEHFNSGVEDTDISVIWKGRIKGAEWKEGSLLSLTSESVFSSLQRLGLRRRFQLTCPHALYGPDCGISRAAWAEPSIVTGISGNTITTASAALKASGWYAGGYVTWTNGSSGNTERRMVRSSTGGTGALELSTIPIGLQIGQEVTLYPGCDHTLEGAGGCSVKFNNFKRYGGTPYMPTESPFGSTIY